MVHAFLVVVTYYLVKKENHKELEDAFVVLTCFFGQLLTFLRHWFIS